ncbi:SLC13 family permease [Oceanobacillus senegalensis]|uniref:SLC13 family permease n=1 Tax=Oceanobacillus senegalensis TaxID=1936063 RepID=UPI0011800406|nr:SLC13 family permease [Oceanobacillus senegalensis]
MRQIITKTNNVLWREHKGIKQLLSLFSVHGSEALVESSKQQGKKQQSNKPPTPIYNTPQKIGLVTGPLLFLLIILLFEPNGLSSEGKAVLAVTLWMAVWWMTEAMPIPVTALLPILLFPLTGALDISTTTSSYSSDIIFLFMGGFLVALAMERWNLHRRIALTIISVVGTSAERLILGFMVATAFLSMWISSTATTMMMVPIGTAIILKFDELLDQHHVNGKEATKKRFGKALMLAISYSALTGGLGTLIGTPPNAILVGFVNETYGINISFASWMLFGVPVAILFTSISYFLLVKVLFRFKLSELPGGKEIISNQKKELGPMSIEEKMVATVFVVTALAWITRTFLLQPYVSPNISDAIIAMAAAFILFLLPSKQKGETILNWETATKLPWGILILFGGGLAIAAGFTSSGLTEWIGNQLTGLSNLPFAAILFFVIFLVIFLTEITSNTATATMLIPIMGALAVALEVDPLAFLVGTTIAASCAFMFPIATPPNAIVFSSGVLTISDMAKAGFWLNITFSVLLTAIIYAYLPLVWNFNITGLP